MKTFSSVEQQHSTPYTSKSRSASKRTAFGSQVKNATQIDDDLQEECPDWHNNRLQDLAENRSAIHATAANNKTSRADGLNTLKERWK